MIGHSQPTQKKLTPLPPTQACQELTLLVAHITCVLWGSGSLQRGECGDISNPEAGDHRLGNGYWHHFLKRLF